MRTETVEAPDSSFSALDNGFRSEVRGRAEELKSSISLTRMRSAGLNLDPSEYDFIYGYPPLADLPSTVDPHIIANQRTPEELALYVHLPFCSYHCSFCYFAKRIQPNESFIERYLESLKRELSSAAEWASAAEVTSVYFGGGTPTYLSSERLTALIKHISSAFCLAEDYEWTVESTPETIDLAKARAMVETGVNRISLGVQSFHQSRLDKLSRGHTYEQALSAIEDILESEVDKHNVDLIHGFPHQSPDDLWFEFENLSQFELRSVTWYQLWQHMDTPLGYQTSNQPVTAEQILDLKCLIEEGMRELGFMRDKVDWFVRSKADRQQQQDHKWSGGDFLGLGLSAYGFVNGVYYRNYPGVKDYNESIRQHGWGVGQGKILSNDKLVRRHLMLGIKRQEGATMDILNRAPSATVENITKRAEELAQVGLVEREHGQVRLTEKGQMYGDDVANALGLRSDDWETSKEWNRYNNITG